MGMEVAVSVVPEEQEDEVEANLSLLALRSFWKKSIRLPYMSV